MLAGGNRMKWIKTICSDPIGWSEAAAKTRLRMFILMFFHIAMTFLGLVIFKMSNDILFKMSNDPDLFGDLRYLRILVVIGGAMGIVLVGMVFPVMYLYAMHRLLKIIREEQENKSQI
jgi:hypothetical protein